MKYILTLTLSGGTRLVLSRFGELLALVEIKNAVVRNAIGWDTVQEAEKYFDAQMRLTPDLENIGAYQIEKCEIPQ